ncbi:MAG: homogentisate 1,2-dioxygenase [Candidatus Heimdallarchaeota archaeon]|nr:homogentisate 1,2-dioxygenase [Candidatus Heimdallarchaeota archaeon]
MTKPPIFFLKEGDPIKKAHGSIPEGLYEIEHGRRGFFGRVAHMYKNHKPTGWTRVEGPLQHHSYSLLKLRTQDMDDPYSNPTLCLYNNDCEIAVSRIKQPMPYYARNADGDLCIFIHRGEGRIETDYGRLDFNRGDYIIIPRGTSYRLVPSTEDNFFLYIESTDAEYDFPDRGMLGPNAQLDPGLVETPKLTKKPTRPNGEWEVRVKKFDEYTKVFYPFNPVEDTVAWKGDLTVWKVNIRDFNPIVSPKYHLPPSVHTTFLSQNFVICSFVPRPLEDPDVLRIPFFHSNIDYEEVIFYHDGEFFSRHGIDEADVTHHPPGIAHGPQPQAFDKVQKNADKTHTNEYAVMVDTRRRLFATDIMKTVENAGYMNSWKE